MPAILAIPYVHAAGGWIAYKGSAYLAGTLSSTWIGAFIAGNTTLIGTVSAATASVGAYLGVN